MATPALLRIPESPVGRRSLGGRLRKHVTLDNSLNQSNIEPDGDLPVNDDERERLQRQQRRILAQQDQNLSSPSTPSRRRLTQGTAISGLTNAQLAEHYKDCMKLSTENKITKKNAFGLHLIDYMADMLKEKDKETNFQLASCTLDASAKIYSYRVDSIHTDTLNMVTGLGMAGDKKKQNDLVNSQELNSEENDNQEKKKRKKNARKSKTIETNLKNITMDDLELEYEPDLLFQKMTTAMDECGVNGLLTFNLGFADDGCELMLDSTLMPPGYDCERYDHQETTNTDVSEFRDMFKEILQRKNPICETFSTFEFLNFKDTDDSSLSGNVLNSQSDPEEAPNYAYNPDDCGQDNNEYNDDDDDNGNDDNIFYDNDNGGGDENETIGGAQNGAFSKTIRPARLETVSELATILAERPSDYSYFDRNMISAWGGPNHWRLRPQTKKRVDPNAQIVRKRVKKVQLKIDFATIIDEGIKRSKKVLLSASTLQGWSTKKITLPKDLHSTVDVFYKSMLKPNLIVRLRKSTNEGIDVDNGDGVKYNYDNPQDMDNFCGNIQDDSSDDEDPVGGADFDEDIPATQGFEDEPLTCTNEGPPTSQINTVFTGDNLIQQPYKIDKISIQYEKTAKKIDVRKVKDAMWKVLTKSKCSDLIPGDVMSEEGSSFSQLMLELPKFLSETAIKNLSVPIAFVLFLHIVNEKQLTLTSTEELGNFQIEQDLTF